MKHKPVIILVLSIFILYGLTCDLLYSYNLTLDSTNVVPGLTAIDIFQHGNFQRNFPINDPYIFTDIYTFYLPTQYLSHYNLIVYKLTAFFIYLLALAVFTYIIYTYAGTIAALIFAALFSNLTPMAHTAFLTPTYHIGTILAAGILYTLFDPRNIKKANNLLLSIYVIFIALIAFSDNFLFVFFIIPYVICYIIFIRKSLNAPNSDSSCVKDLLDPHKLIKSINKFDVTVISFSALSLLTMAYKTYQPKYLSNILWAFYPKNVVFDYLTVPEKISLYAKYLLQLLNGDIYSLITKGVTPLGLIVSLIMVSILIYSLVNLSKNARYLYYMFLISALITFIAFITTEFSESRYLTFTVLSIFAVIALAYDENKEGVYQKLIFIALIVVLLTSVAYANYTAISKFKFEPNENYYSLVSYMESNNLTYGYTNGYANNGNDIGNLITYISGGKVTLRGVNFSKGELHAEFWQASKTWEYEKPPGTAVILFENKTGIDGNYTQILDKYPPSNILRYKEFTIFEYNNSSEIKVIKY